jgi:glycosyltransferase involved in cell wall biosynthesis
MKITYATHPTAFETPGGGEIQILQYRKHLAADGVNVSLFDPWEPNLGNIDVFHYFSCYRGSENFVDELARRGIPIVLSPTLWVEKGAAGYPLEQIKQMMGMAGRIVCNSDMECDLLSDTFSVPRAKFATVYNGVDSGFMQPADSENFRSSYDIQGDFVLNVANVEPRKNQLRLIEAVKRLGLQLVMIGGIRDQAYFSECMSLGAGCLTYIPALPHDSGLLRAAYASCSLFALPSMLETPGLAALEAACVGAKVLVTGVGCAREYFQDHAVYVDPLSVDSIVAGIEEAQLSSDPDAARDIVRREFTWPVVIERLMEVYQNKDVFCPSLSTSGFHLAEFDPATGLWSVWSKHAAEIVSDKPGMLTFEWRAVQPARVDVLVDGAAVLSELQLGTDWVAAGLVLDSDVLCSTSRVSLKVMPLDPFIRCEDPRELGVALRNVRLADVKQVVQ